MQKPKLPKMPPRRQNRRLRGSSEAGRAERRTRDPGRDGPAADYNALPGSAQLRSVGETPAPRTPRQEPGSSTKAEKPRSPERMPELKVGELYRIVTFPRSIGAFTFDVEGSEERPPGRLQRCPRHVVFLLPFRLARLVGLFRQRDGAGLRQLPRLLVGHCAALHSAIVFPPLLRLQPEQSNCRLSG